MRSPRPRHYVSRRTLHITRPLFRYSHGREAYVLRLGGRHIGPVLREERRLSIRAHEGPERRTALASGTGTPIGTALR